jgi:hypothetical protein
MSETHSTAPAQPGKPAKPYPDFPLYAHAAGYWAKRIRGKIHYFGLWEDPDGALTKYLDQKDALHAGRKPRADAGGVTVRDLANAFLNAKKARVDVGELSPRTWAYYKQTCDLVVKHFGKGRLGRPGPRGLRLAKDQPAVDHIMGHESPHMSTVYRERISDERLKAVTDHVRGWLFPAHLNPCKPSCFSTVRFSGQRTT